MTLIDDMVGRLVAALVDRGLLEQTLIIFTTDHGEMLFDRGRLGKGNFFEPVIRAPFIVVPPGGPPTVTEVNGLVETFDIAPTALDYAGAQIPSAMSAASLRPILEGQSTGKEAAVCEYLTNDRSLRGTCVRTPRYKYARWSGGRPEELYDLQEDPLERQNRATDPQYRDEVDRHRLLLIDHLMHTPA